MRENVAKNVYTWDSKHTWPKDGDEWVGQADICGVPYEVWKESLVQHLIVPYVDKGTCLLEIGPGHGRWTKYHAELAGHVITVDVSASCLNFCRERLDLYNNVDYFLTAGETLPRCATGMIDVVWSYDAFVHMDEEVIRGYLHEIRRVLKTDGAAMIHHSNIEDVTHHRQDEHPGWRSAMTGELMCNLAREAELEVVSQFVYWDEERRIGVPRFDDRITHLRRAPGR